MERQAAEASAKELVAVARARAKAKHVAEAAGLEAARAKVAREVDAARRAETDQLVAQVLEAESQVAALVHLDPLPNGASPEVRADFRARGGCTNNQVATVKRVARETAARRLQEERGRLRLQALAKAELSEELARTQA